MATKKNDPFMDALSDDDATESRSKSPPSGKRAQIDPTTHGRRGFSAGEPASAPARIPFTIDLQSLPIPILAGLIFALFVGLSTLLTSLIGRFVIGGRGLDDAMLRFASESGVSAPMMAAAAPLLAMAFAVLVYINATRRIERIAQSVSRALLVVLLTWMAFGAWATKLWCLPADYASCYSRVLAVAGLLGGGPILLAGLVAGYVMGRVILKRRAG